MNKAADEAFETPGMSEDCKLRFYTRRQFIHGKYAEVRERLGVVVTEWQQVNSNLATAAYEADQRLASMSWVE